MRLFEDKQEHASYANLNEWIKNEEIEKFRENLLHLHNYDQLVWFQKLEDVSMRKRVYEVLSPKEMAEIFQKLKHKNQLTTMKEMDASYCGDVLSNMSTNRLADLFNQLSNEELDQTIDEVDSEQVRTAMQLMEHEEDTAGSLMTTEFISFPKDMTIEDAIQKIRAIAQQAETIFYIYVEDEQKKLAGVISLRHLLAAEGEQTLRDFMKKDIVYVHQDEDQEEVANLVKNYDLIALPVVDEDGHLLGIIMVDEIMDVVEEEATEDLGEFSASRGTLGIEISALIATKKRAPWIMGLLLIGLVTAQIIGYFESTLEQVVMISAFIPLVMGAAGNTGTQTLAVIVRSIATGKLGKKQIGKIILRELSTGFMIGVCAAAVLLIIIPIFYGQNWPLAFVVGGSVFVALGFATLIGCVIPIAIDKLKIDPAIASGPFITTLNDMVSILIYFLISTSFLQYLQ